MKNYLFLIGLVVCLAGCGGDSAPTAPEADELSQYVADNPDESDPMASVDDGDTAE
jgi:hypothetical protein